MQRHIRYPLSAYALLTLPDDVANHLPPFVRARLALLTLARRINAIFYEDFVGHQLHQSSRPRHAIPDRQSFEINNLKTIVLDLLVQYPYPTMILWKK